jgi:phosphoribosyl 1,2-cyclic phosphate phosphodiesterase
MEIEILGSGGAVPPPRPGCHCATCVEARTNGTPYARSGPSTFIRGANILFDTPEESREQLNRSGIDRVAACFYSHWHPDHVMGRRVFEALNWDVRSWPPESRATDVYLPQQVAADVATMLGTGDHLAYLERLGVVRVHTVPDGETVAVGGLAVTAFRLAEDYVYAFLVEEGATRVLIAPDELHGWSPPEWLRGVDLAILPMGMCVFDPFTGERRIPAEHPILGMEMTFPETLDVVRALRPKQVVLSHIEEMDGLGHDQLGALAERCRTEGLPVTFAHDMMRRRAGGA